MLMDSFSKPARSSASGASISTNSWPTCMSAFTSIRQEIKNGEANEQDPIQRTAAAIAEESWLLCFDEFHIPTLPTP